MKIGLLVCGVLPEPLQASYPRYGDMYENLLAGRGFEFTHYHVRVGEFPTHPSDMDGWLVTGSEYGAYDDVEWIGALKSTLHRITSTSIPVLGICFGHQILAQVMGGRVEKFDGGWNVGRQQYSVGSGNTFHALAWHQDQVVEAPANAKILAGSENCENAIMTIGSTILGIQPHPEFTSKIVDVALQSYQETLPKPVYQQAKDTCTMPLNNQTLADMIESFYRFKGTSTAQLEACLMNRFSKSAESDKSEHYEQRVHNA